MTRMLAMFAMAGLAACGGQTLDVGGAPSDSGVGHPTDGAPTDPPPGPTNSEIILAKEGGAYRLARHGDWLFWMTFRFADATTAFHRCRIDDCSKTVEEVLSHARILRSFGETMFFGTQSDRIVSCPLGGCNPPTEVVPKAGEGLLCLHVDGSELYWSAVGDTAVYACPLTGCSAPARTIVSGVRVEELEGDETRLYYLVREPSFWELSIQSVRKDASEPPQIIARNLTSPSPPRVHRGHVYWSSWVQKGYVARCPVTGCIDDKPEILARDQAYPMNVEPIDDALYWINENAGAARNSTLAASIHGCAVANCASTLATLDYARGPANASPIVPLTNAGNMLQNLVADANAIYYVGDLKASTAKSGQWVVERVAIRRLPRKPFESPDSGAPPPCDADVADCR